MCELDMPQVIKLMRDNYSLYEPPESNYKEIWTEFGSQKNLHAIVAVVDNLIIAYGSVLIETKIRGGRVGHIEDIVVSKDQRKYGVGTAMLTNLTHIARQHDCFKLVLSCPENAKEFYVENGYIACENSMVKYLE